MEIPYLRIYQQERITHIRNWYQMWSDLHLDKELDSSVRYLLAWTVFNALYNVADMPNRKPKKPSQSTGQPRVSWTRERSKLKKIAHRLAANGDFIQDLYRRNRDFCDQLASRTPQVSQPDPVDEIPYEVDGEVFIFHSNEIRGVASLDNRVILDGGYKLFEYETLVIEKRKDGTLIDPKIFIRHMVFVLYQIRNNVAHGGSAAFFLRGNKVSEGAITVLDHIVRHLLKNQDILLSNEE